MRSLPRSLSLAALMVGMISCRGRETPQTSTAASTSGVAQLRAGGSPPTTLYGIAVVEHHLWLTSDSGTVVVDPVNESWGMLELGPRRIYGSGSIIPCGEGVGIMLRDTLAHLDLKTRQFQYIKAPGLPGTYRSRSQLTCVQGRLWMYRDGRVFEALAAGTDTTQYQIPWPTQAVPLIDFAGSPDGGFYFLTLEPNSRPSLFRFDPANGQLDRVALPEDIFPIALQPIDQGLLIGQSMGTQWLLKSPAQPMEPLLPQAGVPDRIAEEKGVVWVGASYDVSPASYFVLRYIRDVMEPKDLVILEGWSRPRLRAVSLLGMLWAISRGRVLRVDPGADELVSYTFTDASGALVKKSFHLVQEGGELLYFDGDTLTKPPAPPPPPPPPPPPSLPPDSSPPADLSEKSER